MPFGVKIRARARARRTIDRYSAVVKAAIAHVTENAQKKQTVIAHKSSQDTVLIRVNPRKRERERRERGGGETGDTHVDDVMGSDPTRGKLLDDRRDHRARRDDPRASK